MFLNRLLMSRFVAVPGVTYRPPPPPPPPVALAVRLAAFAARSCFLFALSCLVLLLSVTSPAPDSASFAIPIAANPVPASAVAVAAVRVALEVRIACSSDLDVLPCFSALFSAGLPLAPLTRTLLFSLHPKALWLSNLPASPIWNRASPVQRRRTCGRGSHPTCA